MEILLKGSEVADILIRSLAAVGRLPPGVSSFRVSFSMRESADDPLDALSVSILTRPPESP
jgi:hypothetical protein